jgi:poly(hydroxyalkanoate) granule-associated protein
MVEEVDVKVSEVEAVDGTTSPLFDGLRRLLLASIGAVALTRDETETFVNKLVERGELAQKEGEKLIHEVSTRVRQGRPQVEEVEERVESGMEHFLNRLNIPSKRDIDELSAKIATLAARVEELRK